MKVCYRGMSRGFSFLLKDHILVAFGSDVFAQLRRFYEPFSENKLPTITLMCEVESILNGRPITTISSDPRDQEPLTPNHLLLLRSEPSMPPGLFPKEDSLTMKVETGSVPCRHLLETMDQRTLASSPKQTKLAVPQKKFSCWRCGACCCRKFAS